MLTKSIGDCSGMEGGGQRWEGSPAVHGKLVEIIRMELKFHGAGGHPEP